MGDTTADTSDPTDAAGADGDHPVPLVTSTSTSSETHPEPSESSNHSVLIIDDDDDDDEEKRQAVLPDDGSSSDSGGCEIISVDSDDEDDDGEGRWRSVSEPLNRLNALISAGYDNPRLLLTRIFGMDESILPTSSSSLWGIIYNILSDPTPRRRLKQYSTLDSVVKLINSSSRILVLTGAGISVSCGIPDFRSRDGIYARLAQDYPDLTSPQAMFEMDFFLHNPLPFFKFAKEIFPGQFKPSLAHWFISLLERKGKLLRNYTQNIDTLEQQAGISRIIQCHGSFATATCTTCSYRVPGDAIRDSILGQTVPRCPKCCPSPPVALSNGKAGQFSPTNAGGTSADESTTGPDAPTPILSRCLRSRGPIRPPPEISSVGVMKPDIVFFGEGLPSEFHSSLAEDIKQTDLVIVMGSSLKVRPVSHIPFSIPVSVPQVLINRESLSSHTFDVELLGDCDVVLDELCSRLENTFTRIPPNQYVFKGAELPFDYEMAEDCLQHEGDLFGDPSSSSSPDSSSASLSPSTFSELATGSETSRNVAAEEVNHRGDRVVARLLRKCRADPELQRCLQAKAESRGASNGSLSANHERPETGVNAVPQDAGADEKGEEEDCVILSDPSLSPPTSQQKNNDQGVPTTDTGLVAKSTDGADFPNAKRRKCDPTKADPSPPPTASSAQSAVPATDAAATAAL
nr:unnamed protein product [Spirometra erinaceieuropaei]